jgi:opacity protein-like surface antigen
MRQRISVASTLLALALVGAAAPAFAQEHKGLVYGQVGGASIGHADSEQGKAPIIGGGVSFNLTTHLVVEGDVHAARVSHVFGRDHHDFSEVTFTASVFYRTRPNGKVHVVAGGGLGVQRAHVEFDEPGIPVVNRDETLRLLHGRAGVEWDVSDRVVIRTEGVLWLGGGLDWVTGGRVAVGYRF